MTVRARAFSRLICNDFARAQSERAAKRREEGSRGENRRGRRYEWFISRGRLIFRPSCGGTSPWKRWSSLSLACSLDFFPFSLFVLCIIRPTDTQFNRVLPRTRVFVRHYRDRVAVYCLRASRRYFLWLGFHVSHFTPGVQPTTPDGFSTTAGLE